ncbi:MAG: hypothetical protein IT311_03085 [Anaerolineales bacterium]|nr:hypothetical protein [Anaerolineales bacterium]
MEDPKEFSQQTVSEFLEYAPQASKAFLELGMACISCHLARFCTLEEVRKAYKLDEKTFFEAISKYLS